MKPTLFLGTALLSALANPADCLHLPTSILAPGYLSSGLLPALLAAPAFYAVSASAFVLPISEESKELDSEELAFRIKARQNNNDDDSDDQDNDLQPFGPGRTRPQQTSQGTNKFGTAVLNDEGVPNTGLGKPLVTPTPTPTPTPITARKVAMLEARHEGHDDGGAGDDANVSSAVLAGDRTAAGITASPTPTGTASRGQNTTDNDDGGDDDINNDSSDDNESTRSRTRTRTRTRAVAAAGSTGTGRPRSNQKHRSKTSTGASAAASTGRAAVGEKSGNGTSAAGGSHKAGTLPEGFPPPPPSSGFVAGQKLRKARRANRHRVRRRVPAGPRKELFRALYD